jgi:hypothetical protein
MGNVYGRKSISISDPGAVHLQSGSIEHMSVFDIALIIAEVVSLCTIVHLWWRRKMRPWAKILWTVFLLVPLFGPVFYGFLTLHPERHGEETEVGPFSSG